MTDVRRGARPGVRCRSMIGPPRYGTPGSNSTRMIGPLGPIVLRFHGPLPGRMDPPSNRSLHTTPGLVGLDLLPNLNNTRLSARSLRFLSQSIDSIIIERLFYPFYYLWSMARG